MHGRAPTHAEPRRRRRHGSRRCSTPLLPVVVLIVLIGADASRCSGPTRPTGRSRSRCSSSAAFASARWRSRTATRSRRSREAAVGGVTSAMGAIFILLAVGALIGTWNMAGTIPTVVYYGIGLLSPTWFYLAACGDLRPRRLVTGSSWTTAGTLGVAFVGDGAASLGARPRPSPPARSSRGAYFGDKMTPLSETTDPRAEARRRRDDVGEHIRSDGLDRRARRSCIALVVFADPRADRGAAAARSSTDAAQAALAAAFNISLVNLLPLRPAGRASRSAKVPAVPVDPRVRAVRRRARLLHPAGRRSTAFVGRAGARAGRRPAIKAIYAAMANGFVLQHRATRRSTRCSPAAAWRAC